MTGQSLTQFVTRSTLVSRNQNAFTCIEVKLMQRPGTEAIRTPKSNLQDQNGKLLKSQILIVQREHMDNK